MLAYLIFNGIIFAQSYSKSSANINVKLINGAALSVVKSNLDLNQLSKLVQKEIEKQDSKGILLHFTGINTDKIIINYNYSESYKIKPEGEINDNLITLLERPIFQPIVRGMNNLDDEFFFEIINGASLTFNKRDHAALYLLLGRSLNYPNSSIDGLYSGTFTLSLVYN